MKCESGWQGQPASGHFQRFILFRDQILRTHQCLCHPHLSLRAGAVSHVVDCPKVVLRPVQSHNRRAKSVGWDTGFVGPDHIHFHRFPV
jgi:hypothetical protein